MLMRLFLGMIFNLLLLFASGGCQTVLSHLSVTAMQSCLVLLHFPWQHKHNTPHTHLIWWKEHQHQDPLLASAAHHFFTLLATSVASVCLLYCWVGRLSEALLYVFCHYLHPCACACQL